METRYKCEMEQSKGNDLVTLHLDTMGFTSKPKAKGENSIGKIYIRASHNTATITKEELVNFLASGHSIIPGVCSTEGIENYKGVIQKDWVQQDLFFLDFDNEKVAATITLDEAFEKLESYGVKVMIAYYTFSSGKIVNGKTVEKFRIGVVTNQTVTSRELRDKLQATLMGLMDGYIDKGCFNRNRYFNGTTLDKIAYVNLENVIDAKEIVEKHWDETYSKYLPKDVLIKNNVELKKEKNKKIASIKRERRCGFYEDELSPASILEDYTPRVSGLMGYDIKRYCDEYLSLIDAKEWYEGQKRGNFIFDAFNVASFKYGTREAYLRCIELNNKFAEPLSNREFMTHIERAYNHVEENYRNIHDTQFVYRFDTLIDRIELTDDVKERMGYYQNIKNKERADRLRPLKQERNELIRTLYEKGNSSRSIAKTLLEIYGKDSELVISDRAVRKYIAQHIKVGTFQTTIYNNIVFSFSQEEDMDIFAEEPEIAELGLNERQQAAFDDAMLGRNLFITANGGGTGKTFTTKAIIAELKKQGKSVEVCAWTALAAQVYENGKTFHRLFGYNEDQIVYNSVLRRLAGYDAIVIDEVGMLGKKAMDYLGKIVQELLRRNYEVPQLILSGDVLQLPPINDAYFFESVYYRNAGFVPHYLIENIRQSGSGEFMGYLNRLRLGELVHEELNRICDYEEQIDDIYLVPYNNIANGKNMECLDRLEGACIDLGNDLIVKIGAKVIVTKNHPEGKYYNGMQGIVETVSPNVVSIRTTSGELVRIFKRKFEKEGEIVKGFPLALGYALSIHKSQGMTLKSANIDPRAFACGQLYVALSRIKTAKGVHLLYDICPEYIKVSDTALAFDVELRRVCGVSMENINII